MSPDELEPIYFVFDPRDEFQRESIEQFIQSAALPYCTDQLATALGHIQRILNELHASTGDQPDAFPFTSVEVQSSSDSLEQFKQGLLSWQLHPKPDLQWLDTCLGRGKRHIENILDAMCDPGRKTVERARCAIALASALNLPLDECAQRLFELSNLAAYHGHPLPDLVHKARRSLVEKAIHAYLDRSTALDLNLDPALKPVLHAHLKHALSLEFDFPADGSALFSKALEPLVLQGIEFVRGFLLHSAVLVHLIQNFSEELALACCTPEWSDTTMLVLLQNPGNRINGFCPLQFEHLQRVLNQIDFDSKEFHHPVLAECKVSATGLGKQQILYAGKVMWVCIQSHGLHDETERYHRAFQADDLAWFLQAEAALELKIELLGEHLSRLSTLAQDEERYLNILTQASRPRCTLRKWWARLAAKPVSPVVNWNRHLACFALERGHRVLYQYFGSALTESVMAKMIQCCIEKGDGLAAVLRLGEFDAVRVRALISASFNAVWVAQAAEKNRVRLIYFLAQHGADLNVRNVIGRTPLVWATKFASKEAVKALLDCGANPLLAYKNGRDLCHYASHAHCDAEEKFNMLKQALLAAAIRPDCIEPALTWGHEVKTKRSWLKDLDPKPCLGYVWAWVCLGMLKQGMEEIELFGHAYTPQTALTRALDEDPECVPALMAKAACAAIESSDPKGEIVAAYAKAFTIRWSDEGKNQTSQSKPYLADLWASLAEMPLWQSAPQLCSEDSLLLTTAAKTSPGRVTPLDCLINAIELAPGDLNHQNEFQKKIAAYRSYDWLTQADIEFAKTIAQDAEDKYRFKKQ